LIPEAHSFYKDLEKQLAIKCFKELPIRRFFTSEDDLKRANRRINNPRYKGCFKALFRPNESPISIKDDFGSIAIAKGSWVDVPLLLKALKEYFQTKHTYIESHFDVKKLTKHDNEGAFWRYQTLRIKKVIFCQGVHTLQNPYFSELPIIPIKGDTLTLKLKDRSLPEGLYYKKRWLHALATDSHNPQYRLGASYEVDNSNPNPSKNAQAELLQALEAMFGEKIAVEILEHKSGIRPTCKNARPFIIQHPTYPSLMALHRLSSTLTPSTTLLRSALANYFYESKAISAELLLA